MSATTVRPLRLWPRPFWDRFARVDPFHKDIALAVLIFVSSMVELVVGYGLGSPGATVVGLAVVSATVAYRRRAPAAAAVVAGVAIAIQDIFGGLVIDGADPAFVGYLFLLYSLGAYCELRVAVVAGSLSWACFAADALFNRNDTTITDVLFVTMFVGAAVTIGRAIRNRRLLNRALRERARRLEAEREDRAREAVAAERRRIAAELHDVVTHAVSSMVVQAGAVRHVVHRNPTAAGSSLGDIELDGPRGAGRHASPAGRAATRGGPGEPGAAARRRADPRPRRNGDPGRTAHDARDRRRGGRALPRPRPRGLPRGGGGPARRLPWRRRDDRHRARSPMTTAGSSSRSSTTAASARSAARGSDPQLVSIRERVGLFGGELHTGPGRGGGFAVRARLPLAGLVSA